jgi:hypothetical protein
MASADEPSRARDAVSIVFAGGLDIQVLSMAVEAFPGKGEASDSGIAALFSGFAEFAVDVNVSE